MTKDEALRLAWDALQQIAHVSAMDYEYQQWAVEAITAIKEALAQPEQEPVAWAKFSAKGNIIDLLNEPDDDYTPLYTTPPQRTWVGLTEVEADKIYKDGSTFGEMMRMVEAKLKEKNT